MQDCELVKGTHVLCQKFGRADLCLLFQKLIREPCLLIFTPLRNIRELRKRLQKEGMAMHPLIGPDPERWRKDAAEARRSKKKKDGVYILKNMLVGH